MIIQFRFSGSAVASKQSGDEYLGYAFMANMFILHFSNDGHGSCLGYIFLVPCRGVCASLGCRVTHLQDLLHCITVCIIKVVECWATMHAYDTCTLYLNRHFFFEYIPHRPLLTVPCSQKKALLLTCLTALPTGTKRCALIYCSDCDQ